MNTQEKVALESLIAKLNSLRKTLSDDEREILDSMVITDFDDEVNLHRYDPKADPKYDPKADPKYDPKADPAVDDDEVSLHRFDPKADPKVSLAATPKSDPKIIFDPETETYKVVGRAID